MFIALSVIGIGISLILSPDYIQQSTLEAAAFTRVMGALVTAFGTIALWEVLSGALWACFLAGFALVALPFSLLNEPLSDAAINLIAGLLIMGLSLLGCIERKPKGYAGGWSSLWRRESFWRGIRWE